MNITRYQDNHFFYFWKPAGIPSTFGKEKSFLDVILSSKDRQISDIVLYLKDMFTQKQEYGLLNRLDNDTSWLLYFAKNSLIKNKYKLAQSEWKIIKYYIADVYWDFTQDSQKISHPIWHHKFSDDRMVVFLEKQQSTKIDIKRLNYVETEVQKLYYDDISNTSTLLVKISKWIRHQIRAHLSSIWYPVVGEKIYIRKKSREKLHLFSIWLQRL